MSAHIQVDKRFMNEAANKEPYDHHRGRQPLLRPTSRWRAGLFLAINLAGFAVVCAFWQYLTSGSWTNFTPDAFRRELTTSLGELVVGPLSVLTHPWMILVTALLLAVVIFVPITVAVLYRLRYAGLFIAVLIVVAKAPVLGIFLSMGCLLASVTRLRSNMPFVAILPGLFLAAIYFFLLGFAGSELSATLPQQRWALIAPFVLAGLGALLSASLVLALAKLTGFRPGIVCPVLAILLAGPLVIFYVKIGPAELDYALISKQIAEEDAIFKPKALAEWAEENAAQGLNGPILNTAIQDDLETRCQKLIKCCDRFLAKYPQNSRAPTVLWIKSQCQSLQVNESALDTGLIKYSACYTSRQSERSWNQLLENYPISPQAALASWRLAQLALRKAETKKAFELLESAFRLLRKYRHKDEEAGEDKLNGSLFSDMTAIPRQRYYRKALFDIEHLIWLIRENNILSDPVAAEALAAYLRENPNQKQIIYCGKLDKLLDVYEGTKLGDNLILAVAKATGDTYVKAEMLIGIARDSRTDAAIEANFELGRLALRTAEAPALALMPQLKSSREYFELILSKPLNPWTRLAAEYLGP